MKRYRSVLACAGLLAFAGAMSGSPAAADWKAQADARIERIRRQDVRVQITDGQGTPVQDAQIAVRQVRKAFPFGAAMGRAILGNTRLQEFFKEHFNYAVFENETKWYANERAQGRENYADADALFAWCQANGIPVRGHCIFWEPEKWQPRWVRPLTGDELRQAVERRIESVVTHFRGKFVSWDVDNETLHGDFFKARLGEAIWPWMFRRAHELDPDAKLFVNEFNILSVDKDFTEVQTDEYVAHVRRLIDQGAPIHGVGIQGHIWAEDILSKPEVIKERLDKVATLNLPIWISEFDVADDDERSCADKLELVYRTAYSHPAVEGIVMWVVWAGNSWRGPNAGLARRDWTLNEAGQRYEALMSEWSTQTSGRSDAEGRFAFRGFHGDYEITVTPPEGEAVRQPVQVTAGPQAQSVTIRLN
ncbi:MAG TPA: endo-1,4-beta-xylanase [Sedimentisphaerales bacterium]|nr:endo-1,4-beta-xylanase [Sedimentisphaerales bacterium]HRS09765.1 endo-1,4-beta-xylanase [Sedimentisphaerales bacterium]HRV46585.1 endo-1,4-beta-xylanase [Sedimentisphaerales bacterium]